VEEEAHQQDGADEDEGREASQEEVLVVVERGETVTEGRGSNLKTEPEKANERREDEGKNKRDKKKSRDDVSCHSQRKQEKKI
jgi:hypothetical protein